MKITFVSSLLFALAVVAAPTPEEAASVDKRQYSYYPYDPYYPTPVGGGNCIEAYGACNQIYPPCCEGYCELVPGASYGYCNPGVGAAAAEKAPAAEKASATEEQS